MNNDVKKNSEGCSQKYNPLNRFMFLFCRQYEVDEGWGCYCCGCRVCSFSLGVIIFAGIILISSIKDFFELANSDIFYKKSEENKDYFDYFKDLILDEKDYTFINFFRVKFTADIICILAAIIAFISICSNSYCISLFSYYASFISFVLNTSFLIFILTRICNLSFWEEIGFTKLLNLILWFVFDYILLLFAWFLFCNMVNIKRKIAKIREITIEASN